MNIELSDRYGLELLCSSSYCDGCTAQFTTSHALSCKVGGLVSSIHNEGRDTTSYLAYTYSLPSNVRDKPLIKACRVLENSEATHLVEPITGLTAEIDGEHGDLLIHGFWEKGTDCIIDASTLTAIGLQLAS